MNTTNLIATASDYSGATAKFPVFRIVDLLPADELAAMGDAIHETVDRVARALRTPYADSAPEQDLFHQLQTVALSNPVYASTLLHAVYADADLDPRIADLQHDPRPVREDSTCHTLLGACWIPLCDTDADNGGLELVTAPQSTPLAHTRTETERFVIPDTLLDGMPRHAPAVRAGEAAVIGRYTPHRSLPGTGPRVRWSVVAWVKGNLLSNT
jgi:hypothetical protein